MVVLLLVLVAAPAAGRQGADDFYGRPVAEVRFEVDGQPDTAVALTNLVDVREGQPLTRENVRASMDHLFGLGRYDDVTPVVTATPAGLVVTFRLVPRYPISRVQIAPGETGVSPGVLRQELTQRFTGVATGVRLQAVEDATRRLLNDAGYLSAEASATTAVEPAAGSATLVVSVRPGPLALVMHSEVRGTSPVSPSDVLKRTSAEPGRPFRRRQIETRLTEIEDQLRARGFYEAQASLEVTPSGGGVDVAITLEAGPAVDVRVDPADQLPGKIDDLIPVRRERSADQDLLEDAKAGIERVLRRNGYADASVSFERQPGPDGSTLTIRFVIDRGPRYYVERVDLPAGLNVPGETIRGLIAVNHGDPFDYERLEAGIVKVVEEYRRRGYYQSKAEPKRQVLSDRGSPTEQWVVLEPEITEGPSGRVTDITFSFEGPHRVADADLRTGLRSRVGAPYAELDAVLDQDAVLRLYRARGYLSAAVALQPRMTNNGADVALAFTINEGPQVVVGRVTVLGFQSVSEQQILEVAGLTAGQPLGIDVLSGVQRRLANMGVFRRVSVSAEDRLSGEVEAHVVISVVENPSVTGGFGGGLEGGTTARSVVGGGTEDRIEFSPRGFFEIGRRNLGGRNRSLNFFSRLSLKPRSTPDNPETDGRGFGFAEYRVTTTYREQRAFRTDADILFGVTSEQVKRSTYSYLRRGMNAEILGRLGGRVSVSGLYRLEFTRLFDERIAFEDQPLIDRLFPQVRLSVVSGGVSWDGRDSPIVPTHGSFVSADAELGARSIGSEVGYAKTFLQASHFRPVVRGSRTVLAVRAQLGAARGFSRMVTTVDENGTVTTRSVQNLPVSQRFFAGGGTTVRGFQLDRLGIYEPACPDPAIACSVIDQATGLSLGGNAVVVLNAEARRVVAKLLNRNFAVVGFLDGGNVFVRASDLDLSRMRGTVGFGVRYDSALGPLRLDFGFKTNRLVIANRQESGWEYHLSIGEAF